MLSREHGGGADLEGRVTTEVTRDAPPATTPTACGAAPTCPCMEPCPMRRGMEMLGGKWKLPILCALHFDGPLRYNELGRRIEGISNTMLAGSLKELERDGLVSRTQYPEIPVRVEYATTEACEQLVPAFEIIGAWSRASIRAGQPAR